MKNIHEMPARSQDPAVPGTAKDTPKFSMPPIAKLNLGRGRGKREPHYTPWLVVRADYQDTGDRPLAPGSVFWESPDVWVTGSRGVNQPVAGEANQVFARVSNQGSQNATGVMVKFWWANPSMAITESSAHLIGMAYTDVPSGWSVSVPCPTPWIPVVENGGHECLIAEAFIPASDPLTSPMDPMDDRHVGQKNEQLVLLKKGASFKVTVQAMNITNASQKLNFDVQTLHLETIHPLLKLRAAELPVKITPAKSKVPLNLSLGQDVSRFVKPSALLADRLVLRGLKNVGAAAGRLEHASVSHAATFKPWETRPLEISGQLPRDAKAGQSFLFRAVQRIGDMVTGGYTIHVVVVD